MSKPAITLAPEARELLRRCIRDAREVRSALVVTAAEMELVLDAYEALLAASLSLLDKVHPRRNIA